MEKEETLLRKRFIELANTAYQRGIAAYSDFLNLNELNILHTTPKELFPVPYRTFGGYSHSERQMVAFLPDAFSLYMEEAEINQMYPMKILKITPVHAKFAEELGHRDYLGALLNLGIERTKIGDILVQEKVAYVFVHESMADYLVNELVKVRHTVVLPSVETATDFIYEPKFEIIRGTVSSVRLDVLLSLSFQSSRSKLTPLIEGGKVYVNGKNITSNAYRVKNDDIISVRGMGRFQFKGIVSKKKKGRYCIELYKYV